MVISKAGEIRPLLRERWKSRCRLDLLID